RAVELAREGRVEALMKGSLHTDELMAAVVSSATGLRTKRRVSHCFVLQTPHYPRPFIVTDAAINLAPDLAQKADIIRNAIELAHVIGVERPKVAILAAVETVTPTMPATLDAAALCKMADRGQIEGGVLDGPLAFDNAVSIAAARTKGIVSEVAGQADNLVVPDLESGNMLAKQVMFMGDAASAGIVLRAKVPAVRATRPESREWRLASCADPAVLAQGYRTSPGRATGPPRRFARVAHGLVRDRADAGAPLSHRGALSRGPLAPLFPSSACGGEDAPFARHCRAHHPNARRAAPGRTDRGGGASGRQRCYP